MPDRPNYPDAEALKSYAGSMGLMAVKTQPLAAEWAGQAAGAAAAEWERKAGWRPFLAPTDAEGNPVETTRYFDPPTDTRFIGLNAGLLTLTSLATGATTSTPGTVRPVDAFFRLLPQNAPAMGRPFDCVEFLSSGYSGSYGPGFGPGGFGYFGFGPYGRAGSVAVTGAWGRQLLLSDDVYRAVLALGLITALPELATLRRKGLVSWTEGGVTENYGPKPFLDLEDRLSGIVERVLPLYTRKPLYL
jgi:hypothetical protein